MDKDAIGRRSKKEQRHYTWLQIKQNKECYLMLLPFMLFFLVFTIIPVIMSLPMGMTVDERICGGAVYARLFASMKHYLKHPEELEAPPDRVYYNEGAEYHVPKPDNVALPHSVTLNA